MSTLSKNFLGERNLNVINSFHSYEYEGNEDLRNKNLYFKLPSHIRDSKTGKIYKIVTKDKICENDQILPKIAKVSAISKRIQNKQNCSNCKICTIQDNNRRNIMLREPDHNKNEPEVKRCCKSNEVPCKEDDEFSSLSNFKLDYKKYLENENKK
jgi:hypothetical protein